MKSAVTHLSEGAARRKLSLERNHAMTILSHQELAPTPFPGLTHRTLAGAEHGLSSLAVWVQRIDAGGATPSHKHDCEEVVLIQEGGGTLIMYGREHSFRAGDTLIVPRNEVHQIINTGSVPMQLLAALSAAPVAPQFPDGTPIELPWQ
jgi:mannose-6-phosphate isomerase-like protein (cupin superfamily)